MGDFLVRLETLDHFNFEFVLYFEFRASNFQIFFTPSQWNLSGSATRDG